MDKNLTMNDIMDSLDSDMIESIQYMTKKKYVEKHHNRKISFLSSRNIWRTYIGSPRKEVTRKTEKDLIYYLYKYYKDIEEQDTSFGIIFNDLMEYKLNVENVDENTVIRDRYVYKRFITEDFANLPIDNIDGDFLNNFIRERVKEIRPKEKAFNSFTSILNQTFKYARRKKYITANPYEEVDKKRFYKECDHTKKTGDEKIFSEAEINVFKEDIREYMTHVKYDPYGYAILLSIETGMRIGEIPCIRWEDVTEQGLHIHRQQKYYGHRKENQYVEVNYTKNERLHPMDGRYFPITNAINNLLKEIKGVQTNLGIESEFIICKEDGSWILKRHLERRVRRVSKKLGYQVDNNHAFRMSLNSNVLIPLNIPVQERAYLLGHSIEVNMKNYTYMKINSLKNIKSLLDKRADNSIYSIHAPYTQKIVPFESNKSAV